MTEAAPTEWWSAKECAAHWGITPRTFRDYARAGRAPRYRRRNPETGVQEWDAAEVRRYERPGQGARTDLATRPTYLVPAPDGGELRIGEATLDVADMLHELSDDDRLVVARVALRNLWLQESPEDARPRVLTGERARRRARTDQNANRRVTEGSQVKTMILRTLTQLERLELVRREGEGPAAVVRILDRAGLDRLARLDEGDAEPRPPGASDS